MTTHHWTQLLKTFLLILTLTFIPNALFAKPGDVWITNKTQAYRLDKNGNEVFRFNLVYSDPVGMAADPKDGSLWVLTLNNVTKYDKTGALVSTDGGIFTQDIELYTKDGSIVAADRFSDFRKYDQNGARILTLPVTNAGDLSVAADQRNGAFWTQDGKGVKRYDAAGNQLTVLSGQQGFYPNLEADDKNGGIILSTAGPALVAAGFPSRGIFKVDDNGNYLFTLPESSTLSLPTLASVNPNDGSIWYAGQRGNLLKKSDASGNLLFSDTSYNPTSISVDPTSGNLWLISINPDRTHLIVNLDSLGNVLFTLQEGSKPLHGNDPFHIAVVPGSSSPSQQIINIQGQLKNLKTQLQGSGIPKKEIKRLKKAIKKLGKAASKLNKGDTGKAIKEIGKAVKELQKFQKKTNINTDAYMLSLAILTQNLVKDAVLNSGKSKAMSRYNDGVANLAQANYKQAIKDFRKAFKKI